MHHIDNQVGGGDVVVGVYCCEEYWIGREGGKDWLVAHVADHFTHLLPTL